MTAVPPVIDPDTKRDPPKPATPLDFPCHTPVASTNPHVQFDLSKNLPPIRGPSHVQLHHVEVLNLKITRDIGFDTIIPRNASDFAPPLSWWEDSSDDDSCAIVDTPPNRPRLSNGETAPGKSRYDPVKIELLFDNEDAFREIQKLPPKQGCTRVRLTQTRKFFDGLLRMSQFWDDSRDVYSTETGDGDQGSPQSGPKVTYTGLRTGTGHDMPFDLRESTVKAFVEMIAWAFQCQIVASGPKPFLAVQKTLIDARRFLRVNRGPKDHLQRRQGIQEGPVMVVQCRPETWFRRKDEKIGEGKGEIWDLLREVGAMLAAAQERAREGIVEIRPGTGQWWTTTQRWGGGPGGEMGSEESKNPFVVSRASAEEGHSERPKKKLAVSRDALHREENWKKVEAGTLWNKKMKYVHIGKDENSEFDDIFLVSSINHHVSILRLRVHPQYLEWLATGSPPASASAATLDLQRTKWFNLFDPNERVEAMDGLWGLFGYLMRSE